MFAHSIRDCALQSSIVVNMMSEPASCMFITALHSSSTTVIGTTTEQRYSTEKVIATTLGYNSDLSGIST